MKGMKRPIEKGWHRPGMRSSDYGVSAYHNHSGKGPKNYRRSDEHIRDEVCEILKWDPDVDASEIDVTVSNGIVYLDGYVDSRHAKKHSERLIEEVRGFQDVQNRLVLKPLLDLSPEKAISCGDEGLFSQEIQPR
jgi:osmotically-inducible protein OsmY